MGKSTREAVNTNTCVTCTASNVAMGIRTTLSLREYHISGMCQQCQDSVFESAGEMEGY